MRQLITKNSVFYLSNDVIGYYDEYKQYYKYVIKEQEQTRIIFMHQSPQFSFRKILIQYMKKVCIKKSLSYCCLHLAVYLLDIFMDNHHIIPERLLLVANVCLLLSAKLEENSSKIPKISDLNSLVNEKYILTDYINLEILVIQFFGFALRIPCTAHYVFYYMQEIITDEDLSNGKTFRTLFYDIYELILHYLGYILEDVHYMQYYQPSKLAAAVIASSRYENGLTFWNDRLEDLTGYQETDFVEITQSLMMKSKLQCTYCTPNILTSI